MSNNGNIEKDLERLPTVLNMKKLTVPKDYIKKFMEAENVFNHQLVYCPKERKLRPFIDYGENHVKEQLNYAGSYYEDNLALNLALGNVCFKTMELFDDSLMSKIEEKYFSSTKSMWHESYALEQPARFDQIVNKHLKPCYEVPEELAKNGTTSKRKFVEEKGGNSLTKLMAKDKKIKTSPSISDCSTTKTFDDDEEDEEVIVESSFKSTKSKHNLSRTETSKNNVSIRSETSSSLKVEVKSRFFSQTQENSALSELERINLKKQEIRESLKKLYPPKSTSQQSTDSGFCSSSSQQSQ